MFTHKTCVLIVHIWTAYVHNGKVHWKIECFSYSKKLCKTFKSTEISHYDPVPNSNKAA